MGKSWKDRRHASTGYPYSHMRIAHMHIVRPKVRSEDGNAYYVGLFLDKGPGLQRQRKDYALSDLHQPLELKRLAFIPNYSAYYSQKAATLYSTSRSILPAALQPSLEAVENCVTAVSLPLVQAFQIRGEQLLSSLDRKVDGVCLAAHGWFSPRPGKAQTQHPTITLRLHDSLTTLTASPALEKLVDRAQPSLDFAAAKYVRAHDSLVASEAYHKALQSLTTLLTQLQSSSLFQTLYPVISPLADPTLDLITHSPYYEGLVGHLKPMEGRPTHVTTNLAAA